MRRGSSRRLTRVPTSLGISAVVIALTPALRGRHGFAALLSGGVLNRIDNVLVAGAAAEVAVQRMPDLGFCWIGIVGEQSLRCHEHSRRAVAALQAMLLPESLLDGSKHVTLSETL